MMSKILYLCEHALVVVKENGDLRMPSCHSFCQDQELIFIRDECLKVLLSIFFFSINFCFSELRKSLFQKFLREDEKIDLLTEFERINL